MHFISSIKPLLSSTRFVPFVRRFSCRFYEHIQLTIDDSKIATLTINRPEKRNAFSSLTISELLSAFSTVQMDSSLRGLIVKGNGDYFCAGADLTWMRDTTAMSNEDIKKDSMKLRQILLTCDHLRIPTLCLAKGGCIGGGVGLLSTVKTVVAMPDSWFMFSEVRLGLIPAVISPFVLNRIGKAQCKRYMMIPERINASDALRIGLIDTMVDNEEAMMKYEQEWKKLVLVSAPDAVGLVSDVLDGIEDMNESEQGEFTVDMLCERRQSKEGKEGMNSFFTKTKPYWSL